jgi:type III pantothenate kinase
MRLELDVGNTRIKWRLCDHRGRFDGGVDIKEAFAQSPAWLTLVEDVWVGSVHDGQNEWVIEHFPQAKFAHSQAAHVGLINSYEEPGKMGVDRWLAMLAVWGKNPEGMNIVVDAGTAITLDIIDGAGQHLGGYICPGFQMMKTTLLASTDKVLAQEQWQTGRELGQSTQQCVDHGIQDMLACWVERHSALQPDAKVWVTGGNGEGLASLLTKPVELVPDLVLDGLYVHFSK